MITAAKLWSVGDVAAFLGMSTSWVYHASERGELPCVRIGTAVRFDPDLIREWATERRSPPRTDSLKHRLKPH